VKLLPRILAEEDEEDQAAEGVADEEPRELTRLHWAWTPAIAVITAVPRLLYIFVFTDPENPGVRLYGDVWHHWQIAYLTKEIGLSAPEGPRLWDLKGLDYFWGILHPLLMVGVFDVTGSIDIVLNRLVSLLFSVAVVVLIFHVCRRFWGTQAALGGALIAAFLPTSVMNDASGMLEPLGVALCLVGLTAWPRRGLWSGVAFGLASMARAEAWIFGIGMVVAAFFKRVGSQQRIPLIAGFAVVMVVYMNVLWSKTGNPIYPLWWNFFANAVGKWEFSPVTASQASVRPVLGALLLVSAAGLAWSLWRRPASYMLLTFGFGYWVFVTGMLGFTSYLASWIWWMPITRVFAFPYVFAGILLATLVLWWAPRRLGKRFVPVGWAVVGGALVASQLAWVPITRVFGPSESEWLAIKAEGVQIGDWYASDPYHGHKVAVPDDRSDITYAMARFGGVQGRHLVSEMYDPFAYLPAGYRVEDHLTTASTLIKCWLSEADVRIIAIPGTDPRLALVRDLNPTWFTKLGFLQEARWDVEAVTIPPPGPGECAAAWAAVH